MRKLRKRQSKKTKNFRTNMVTLGVKTTQTIFCVPHIAITLISRELADIEGSICSLIEWKDSREEYRTRRMMRSADLVEQGHEYVDDKISSMAESIMTFSMRMKMRAEMNKQEA